MPKISVIVPVYNVENYLRGCLDSIINQSFKDLEIICVNDGSTDNSGTILQEYADKDSRIKIINKENGGLSSARNVGIMAATGDFLGFVDSDDWIDLDFYEKLYNAAVKYDADIACANLLRVYKHKSTYYIKYRRYKCTKKVRLKYEWAKLPDNSYVMNKIYERRKLQKTGILFEEGITFEDMEFSHNVLYSFNNMVTVPGTCYNYRDNPYSIVNIRSKRNMDAYKYALIKCMDFIQRYNIIWGRMHKYHYCEKTSYSIFNIPFITIKTYLNYKKYYLFKIFKILEIKTNKWLNK